MNLKKLVICFAGIMTLAYSNVPSSTIHRPNVPYWMESLYFQSMQTKIFSSDVSGMVIDRYTDLHWNPAYILSQKQKTLYLDHNFWTENADIEVEPFYLGNYYDDLVVLPRWYSQTSINQVTTTPLYNIAFMMPLTSKITIGLFNRSIFDYGPFRSTAWWMYGGWRNSDLYDMESMSGFEPDRLEVDENQQTVLGTQSEVVLGYRFSNKIDIGLRLGHYIFSRVGDLYDSKWANYPHSSFADLNDESLDIDGNHIELGLGLLYHMNKTTHMSIYGSLSKGRGDEEMVSIDTSDSWSEKDNDPSYYSISDFTLESDNVYSSDGTKPAIALTFEKEISDKFVFRSFFSSTGSNIDLSGSIASEDTSYADRTYDDYYGGNYYFRRRESHSSHQSGLDGKGTEETNQWRWFASLIYRPDDDWSLFGGIQIKKYSFKRKVEEISDYTNHSFTEYTLYDPGTIRYYRMYHKIYSFKSNYDEWMLYLPIGVKANIANGLQVILGTNIVFTLTDQDSNGKLLYPTKISKRWENGYVEVEDIETNRYEEFTSSPAKIFNRRMDQCFGVVYHHSSGAKLFIRSAGDIFDTNNWALGFEMNW